MITAGTTTGEHAAAGSAPGSTDVELVVDDRTVASDGSGWFDRRDLPYLTVLAGVAGAVYAVVVTSTYAFTDDYTNLWNSTQNNSSLIRGGLSGGRPVSAVLQEFAFSAATDASSLRWLRLVGALGILATAVVLYLGASRSGFGRLGALGMGVAVTVVPSANVVGAWATMFPTSWAVAAGLAAGLLAARATAFTDRRAITLLVPAALLFLALADYQPSAMAFWPGLVLGVAARPAAEALRSFLRNGLLFGVVLAAHLVVYRVGVRLAGYEQERAAVSTDVLDALSWFFRDVLPRSLWPFDFAPHPLVAVAVLALVAVGLALRSSAGGVWATTLVVVLQLGSLVAAYLPSLFLADQWPSARTRTALDIAVVVLVGLALQGYAHAARRLPRAVVIAPAAALLSLLVLVGVWRVAAYFGISQQADYMRAREAVQLADLPAGSTVEVVRASLGDTSAPGIVLDEFGMVSLYQPWVPEPFIRLELHRAHREQPARVVLIDGPDAADPGAVTIDFDEALGPG